MTRDELKQIADENEVEYQKNIPTDKLQKLLEEKGLINVSDREVQDEEGQGQKKKVKMLTPKDGKKVKCIIRCIDPNYSMNVAEVGCNGYFASAYLDKEIEFNTFFIPSLLSAKWDKPILDDDGQVKEIRMEQRFIVEYL